MLDGQGGVGFPAALHMYNLGIKSQKLQSTTLHTMQYLKKVNGEIGSIVASTAPDKEAKEALE